MLNILSSIRAWGCGILPRTMAGLMSQPVGNGLYFRAMEAFLMLRCTALAVVLKFKINL